MTTGLWFLGAGLFGQLRSLLERALRLDAQAIFDPSQMAVRFHDQAYEAMWAVAPLLIVMVIVALAAPQILGGWLFTSTGNDRIRNPGIHLCHNHGAADHRGRRELSGCRTGLHGDGLGV